MSIHQKNTSLTPRITTSTPKMLPNTPRPVYFLVRPITGDVVPLIAVDELPPAIQLRGVERNMRIVDTIGMINLGLVERSGGYYETDDRSRVTGGEEGIEDERAGDHQAARSSGSRSPDSVVLATDTKEGVCRHWVQTSWCKWSNSCRYAHTMPMTIEGLQKLGVKDWPIWYRAAYPWLFRARLQSSNPVGPELKKLAKRVDGQSTSSVEAGSGKINGIGLSTSSQRSTSTAPSTDHKSDALSDNNKASLSRSQAKAKGVSQQKCNVGRKQEAVRPQSADFMIKTRPHKSIYAGATIPRGPLINDETTGCPLGEALPQPRSPTQTHRDHVTNKPTQALPVYRRGQAHAKKGIRKEFGRPMMPTPLTRDVLARLRSGNRGSSGSTMRGVGRGMGLVGEPVIGGQVVQSDGNRSSRSVDDADITRRSSVNEWEVENEICDEELVKI